MTTEIEVKEEEGQKSWRGGMREGGEEGGRTREEAIRGGKARVNQELANEGGDLFYPPDLTIDNGPISTAAENTN